MNNSPPDRHWPFNIYAARPTSPDNSPPEFRWTSRMAFPASTIGSLHPAHQVFLYKTFAALCALPWLVPAILSHPEGSFMISVLVAATTSIGIFFLGYCWAERSIVRQVVLVAIAIVFGTLVFHFNAFASLQVIAAVAMIFLVDRFITHAILIRGTAPHSELIQDQMARLAQSRFWPFPTRRMNFVTFWAPLIAYAWALNEFKIYRPDTSLIHSIGLQSKLLCLLILWPIASSVMTSCLTRPIRKQVWMFREFVQSFRSFLFYNQLNAIHPFVFQSPAGSARSRQFLVTAVILLTAPVTLQDVFSENHINVPASEVAQPDRSVALSGSVNLQPPLNGRHVVVGLVMSVFLCAVNAFLVMATPIVLCFACCGSVLVRLTREGFQTPMGTAFTTANWRSLVDHMRTVDGGKFKDHLLMGVNAYDGTPIIIPRDALREHMHILGETGSGKTSMGLAPLVEQLNSFGDCSVVVFDLKGDDQTLPAILRTTACENSGLPTNTSMDSALWKFKYRYFHPSPDFPSHSFNPLQQRTYRRLNETSRTELLAQSMGLVYGNDYGKKFFTDGNLNRLLDIIRSNPDARSFEELLYLLQLNARNSNSRSDAQASNVDSSVTRLAEIPALNQLPVTGVDPFAHAKIDLVDLFERPQSLLFTLPAATGNSSNEDIARIVLYMLIEAAQCAKQPRHQVFVIIDEFQRIVSAKIGNLLQIARSNDVAMIFANQSLGDLKTASGGEAYSAITGNTRIRQYFSLRDSAEASDLMKASGECIIYNTSYATGRSSGSNGSSVTETVTYSQQISTKLRPNDIIEASDHPNRSVFHMFRGIGAAQYQGYPFILHGVHHITKAEHQRRSLLKWPAPTPSTSIMVPRPFQLEQRNARRNVPSIHVPPAATAPTLHGQSTAKVSPPPSSTTTASPLGHLVPQAPPSRNIVPPAPNAAGLHTTIPQPIQRQQTSQRKAPQQPQQQKTQQRPTKNSPPDQGVPAAPLPVHPATTPTTPKHKTPAAPPLPDPSLNLALEKLRQKLNKVREERTQSKPK